jgi:glycine dehydrogenase subunit 1
VDALLARNEFYTSYTPYQPEASQGLLQAIYEYQTAVAELTAMEVANASMYDGASAAAEAALMAMRLTRRGEVLVSGALHPHYRQVIETYVAGPGGVVREIPAPGTTDSDALGRLVSKETAAVVVSNPNFFGSIEDLCALAEVGRSAGARLIVAVNPISLGVLAPPGACEADIVVGEGQPLGLPLSYGGPYLGLFATRAAFVHQMPGRLVGATRDENGQRGYVLTLQAREQHIRRERATSNICSNQALCALAATIYLALLGPDGLRELGERNLQASHYLAARLADIPGCELVNDGPFFNEFVLRVPANPEDLSKRLLSGNAPIIGGLPLGRYFPDRADQMLWCATETKTRAELDLTAERVREALR